jgi:glycosyltransferase involved in cell wall biosynthesis
LNMAHDELPASPADTDSSVQVLHNADCAKAAGPIRVVWPHRWEHDKGPNDLLALARTYSETLNLRWTILGERHRAIPDAITTFQREFAHRIDHIGYVADRAAYRQHLVRCDWVLSTARHEFFGIAVVEALLAGCLPWLPQRLSYPELLPPSAHGLEPAHPPNQPAALQHAIRQHLLPAIAPNATIRLDDAIESLVESHDMAH